MLPNTIEMLKEFVRRKKPFVKFMLKIYYCLEFTRNHPDTIEEIGIAWWIDKRHFIANTVVLSNFLNLRPNSLNTDFRQHHFEIEKDFSTRELHSIYPNLEAVRFWKLHFTSQYLFCSESSIENISKIPCHNKKIKTASKKKITNTSQKQEERKANLYTNFEIENSFLSNLEFYNSDSSNSQGQDLEYFI